MVYANKFQEDQLKVLDLLQRKSREANDSKLDNPAKVAIYQHDLDHYDLSVEVFGEILLLFDKEQEEIKLLTSYDEDEFIYWHNTSGEQHDEPACFWVELPSGFLKLVQKMKVTLDESESNKDNNDVIALELPDGTTWQDITIWFRNGHDVNIYVKQSQESLVKSDYKKMGFENKKERKPNVYWGVLRDYAELQMLQQDDIDWSDGKADDQLKQQKKRIADTLKTFFQISDDPFYSYRKEKAYRIKLTVIPEQMKPSEVWR